ncbi:MAG: DUF512 domain-containing protein [Desulfuromonadales bacterium]|nr:DUF512 domain-containing protein [Desulfuromonadales bacterium]
MNEGLLIESVVEGSIAEELCIEPGDTLIAINGEFIRDIIDYQYHTAENELSLIIQKADGDIWEVEFDKSIGEPIGLNPISPVPLECGNSCIFCFVHQLPKGLRKSLYVKDEDYRLSFLYGNYVTLTNLSNTDFEKIIKQKLSPLYISVHTTDDNVREHLLGKKNIPSILDMLKKFADAGITMHTQIVLCPGINDGTVLKKSIADLKELYPYVASLAIVPVGLTRHRRGLPVLEPVTKEYARKFINKWLSFIDNTGNHLGFPFMFLADEFFIKAELPFPLLEAYGDLPQIENGVGMVPLFAKEASEALSAVKSLSSLNVTVVTGVSAFPWISDFVSKVSEKSGGNIVTVPITNRLFGEEVTVTGLISGRDIIAALQNKNIGDILLIPDVMLKEWDRIFLDDITIDDLKNALNCSIDVFSADPYGFVECLEKIDCK